MDFITQLIQYTLAICGGISIIAGGVAVIYNLFKKAKQPDTERDETLKKHTEMLDNDNKRLKALEERQTEMEKSQRLLLKGMEALMRHAIDGNNKEQLQKESDNLHDYIFNK